MNSTVECSTGTKYKAVENVNNGNILLIPIRQIQGQDYLLLSDIEAMAPVTALLSNGKMIPFEIDSATLLELVPKRVRVQDVESIWQIHTAIPPASSSNDVTLTQQQDTTTEILQRTLHLEQQFDQLLQQLSHLSVSTQDSTLVSLLSSDPHGQLYQRQQQQHRADTTTETDTTGSTASVTASGGAERPPLHNNDNNRILDSHPTRRSVSPPPAFDDSSFSSSPTSSSPPASLLVNRIPQPLHHQHHHYPLIASTIGRRSSNPPFSLHHSNTSTTPTPIVPSSPAPPLQYCQPNTTSSLSSSPSSPMSLSPPPTTSSIGTSTHRPYVDDPHMPSTGSSSSNNNNNNNNNNNILTATILPPIHDPSSSPSSSSSTSSASTSTDDPHPSAQHVELSAAPPPSYETSIFGTIKALIQHIRVFEHHIPNRHKSPRWLARRAEWVGYEPQTIEQVAYQLVQLEMALLWTAVTESWIQERETWLTLVASARTERHLAGALVNLERHTLVTDDAWQTVRDQWTSELLEVIVSVGF